MYSYLKIKIARRRVDQAAFVYKCIERYIECFIDYARAYHIILLLRSKLPLVYFYTEKISCLASRQTASLFSVVVQIRRPKIFTNC